jgi:hypothetical protein
MTSKRALEQMLNMCRTLATNASDPSVDASKEARDLVKLCAKVVPFEDKVRANWRVTCLHRIAKACDADTVLKVSPQDMPRFEETARAYGLDPVLQDIRMFRNVFGRLDSEALAGSATAAAQA